jgi:5-methylcytosine-specific restriction endonuclease McrA
MPYREYLQTDHWREVRGIALARARHRCQLCNSMERLNVHHRDYSRRGEERAADVIVLCHTCHETFHDRRDLAAGQRVY